MKETYKDLSELIIIIDDHLGKLEKLVHKITSLVLLEDKNSEGISKVLLDYLIERVDRNILLNELYNKGVKLAEIITKNDAQEIFTIFWKQVYNLLSTEAEELELFGNYILDYTGGKNMSDKEKDFINKVFKYIGLFKSRNKKRGID